MKIYKKLISLLTIVVHFFNYDGGMWKQNRFYTGS